MPVTLISLFNNLPVTLKQFNSVQQPTCYTITVRTYRFNIVITAAEFQPQNTYLRTLSQGNVGINIERPDHATLAVGGNVLVSGTLNHYSDKRVKENISIADCQEELQKVKQLNLYNYKYTDEFCDYSNIDQPEQFGVIAQEVRKMADPFFTSMSKLRQLIPGLLSYFERNNACETLKVKADVILKYKFRNLILWNGKKKEEEENLIALLKIFHVTVLGVYPRKSYIINVFARCKTSSLMLSATTGLQIWKLVRSTTS